MRRTSRFAPRAVACSSLGRSPTRPGCSHMLRFTARTRFHESKHRAPATSKRAASCRSGASPHCLAPRARHQRHSRHTTVLGLRTASAVAWNGELTRAHKWVRRASKFTPSSVEYTPAYADDGRHHSLHTPPAHEPKRSAIFVISCMVGTRPSRGNGQPRRALYGHERQRDVRSGVRGVICPLKSCHARFNHHSASMERICSRVAFRCGEVNSCSAATVWRVRGELDAVRR